VQRLADEFEVAGGFLAVAAGDEFVLDFLALDEIMQSGLLDSRDVYEGVGAASLGLDESIALRVVEPLHGSCIQG